jgi:hypothetical protein
VVYGDVTVGNLLLELQVLKILEAEQVAETMVVEMTQAYLI